MNPIAWAWQQTVPTAEKLVLVYLASQSNPAGVGLWNREALAQATDYKPRSIQRLLKNLRDAKLLEDRGDWYVLGLANNDDREPLASLDEIPTPEQMATENRLHEREFRQPLFTEAELDAAGHAIADRLIDAGEHLIDQLASFESRLSAELVRFVDQAQRFTAAADRPAPAPEPPPDPVLLDPRYQQLLDMRISPAKAYETVQGLLNDELDEGRPTGTASEAADAAIEREPLPPAGELYDDTTLGRLERVRDLLAGTGPRDVLEAGIVDAWAAFEAEENKHTVKGETVTGIELLYPAIVAAARRQAGKMTLEQFLDPDAIKACKAPWDQDPSPTERESTVLEAEISTMMAEIGAANHPNCQVQPRVTEKGDDGVTRIETIAGYHRRVTQVYNQLQRLKAMGAA